MDNVLVAGGVGFIGSHLTDLMIERGKNVTVIDSLEPQVYPKFPDYLNGKAKYYFDRINSNRLDYSVILEEIDTIYYFASKVGPAQSMTDIADYVECNINNLGYFLQQLLEFGKSAKRIILSGSMGPYGEGSFYCDKCSLNLYPQKIRTEFEFKCPKCDSVVKNLALDESTKINNISYYGLSKNIQEEMLALFARTYNIEFVSLRYFSVYGPRQAFNNPYAGPIPIWVNNAIQNKDLIIYEDGNQTRDFIYVKDITNINYQAGTFDMKSKFEVINCGTGIPTKIIDVAKFIKENLNSQSNIVITKSMRPGDLRHSLADNSKLKRTLGYDKFINIYDGLACFLASLQ